MDRYKGTDREEAGFNTRSFWTCSPPGSPVFPTAGNSSFTRTSRDEVENLRIQNSPSAGHLGAGGQLPGQASPAGACQDGLARAG